MAEFFKYRRGDNFSPECGEGVLSNLKIIPYSGSGEYGDYIPFDTFPATPSQRYIKIFILYFAPTSLTHLKWFSGSKLFAEITVGVAEGETLSVNYNHEVDNSRYQDESWPMMMVGASSPMCSADLVFLSSALSTSRLLGCFSRTVELVRPCHSSRRYG